MDTESASTIYKIYSNDWLIWEYYGNGWGTSIKWNIPKDSIKDFMYKIKDCEYDIAMLEGMYDEYRRNCALK